MSELITLLTKQLEQPRSFYLYKPLTPLPRNTLSVLAETVSPELQALRPRINSSGLQAPALLFGQWPSWRDLPTPELDDANIRCHPTALRAAALSHLPLQPPNQGIINLKKRRLSVWAD